METRAGTKWLGISTQLDAHRWPSISFGGGGMGGPSYFLLSGQASFVLAFDAVEAVCAFEETPYWSLAEERTRPHHVLNLIQGSPLLEQLRAFRNAPWLSLFLVSGGDMCLEVIAGRYAIEEHPTIEEAEGALSNVMRGQNPASFRNLQWSDPGA
jgi:hypothetical protein